MGYTTEFKGGLKFNRELTHKEWMELKKLGDYSSYDDGTYREYTDTPETIPKSYLQWEPNQEGTELIWNTGEKFYDYIHWLRWLIKHYLVPHGLVLNGEIRWQGEEMEDIGMIVAENNKITTRELKLEGLVCCPNRNHKFVPEND